MSNFLKAKEYLRQNPQATRRDVEKETKIRNDVQSIYQARNALKKEGVALVDWSRRVDRGPLPTQAMNLSTTQEVLRPNIQKRRRRRRGSVGVKNSEVFQLGISVPKRGVTVQFRNCVKSIGILEAFPEGVRFRQSNSKLAPKGLIPWSLMHAFCQVGTIALTPSAVEGTVQL